MTPYSPHSVANWFLKREQMDQMKLHKLVYFAHGWNLGLFGEPLINEEIEAWKYGPVVPSLYHQFKSFGSAPITRLASKWKVEEGRRIIPKIPDAALRPRRLLDKVWGIYGHKSGTQLSALTHLPDSPWSETRRLKGDIFGAGISNELMKIYFRRLALNQ